MQLTIPVEPQLPDVTLEFELELDVLLDALLTEELLLLDDVLEVLLIDDILLELKLDVSEELDDVPTLDDEATLEATLELLLLAAALEELAACPPPEHAVVDMHASSINAQ